MPHSIKVEAVSPIHSYSVKEDDGPATDVYYFDVVTHVDDQAYRLEFDSYDDDLEFWVGDTFPSLDWDEREEIKSQVHKSLNEILRSHLSA